MFHYYPFLIDPWKTVAKTLRVRALSLKSLELDDSLGHPQKTLITTPFSLKDPGHLLTLKTSPQDDPCSWGPYHPSLLPQAPWINLLPSQYSRTYAMWIKTSFHGEGKSL